MLTRVEAQDFRCFSSIGQDLEAFQILVGPNGSGKSSFFDIPLFLGDVIEKGLGEAVRLRSANFHDLVNGRKGGRFRLAVEALFPGSEAADAGRREKVRYELTVHLDLDRDHVAIEAEAATAMPDSIGLEIAAPVLQRTGIQSLFTKADLSERTQMEVAPDQSALSRGNLSKFSAGVERLKLLLRDGVRLVRLDTGALSSPVARGAQPGKRMNGSYLAPQVLRLSQSNRARFAQWTDHVRTVLPEIDSISTELRGEDQHRYLTVRYRNGVDVPSWLLSEGTLRLMALTILPYASSLNSAGSFVYLIEEPEDGIHPPALEAVFRSLSSVYDHQVLVATHSPLLLGLAEPGQLLCFSKGLDGPGVKRGDQHPALAGWQHDVDLGTFVASGILG